MKKLNFNIKDRKVLTLGLCLVLVCVFTLTIAYAALNAVLTIQGSAQVSSADWDIHLVNPIVKSGSVTTDVPVITSGKSLTFNTTLNMPGDFYEFTVDVVNSGTIDGMIEKVTKTPELTAEQAKYLKYEVSYANGESVTSKQMIAAGVTMPIKVRVEYRNDLVASDLPTGQVVLNLSLVIDYTQSDGTGSSVLNNGGVDQYAVGTEKCFDTECFYIISSTDDTVTMLAKYNLYVSGEYNSRWSAYGDEATGKQDSTMIGYGTTPKKGITNFSNTNYWSSTVSSYPSNVFDSNSMLYSYVENYKTYLSTLGVTLNEARLITYEELIALGCNRSNFSCSSAPSWVYTSSYWSGSANSSFDVWFVYSDGYFNYGFDSYSYSIPCGVRPVIVISKSIF